MKKCEQLAGAETTTEAVGIEPGCAMRNGTVATGAVRGGVWWLLGAVVACTLEPQPIELPVAEQSPVDVPEGEATAADSAERTDSNGSTVAPSSNQEEELASDFGPEFGASGDAFDAGASDAALPSPDGGTSDAGLDPVEAASVANGPDAG